MRSASASSRSSRRATSTTRAPAAGERHRGRLADARRRAGHDDDRALQTPPTTPPLGSACARCSSIGHAWTLSNATSPGCPRSTTAGRLAVHPDDALAAALLDGGVAGTATHPLDNVRANALMLIDGDPDKLFGLTGLPGGFDLDGILDLVADERRCADRPRGSIRAGRDRARADPRCLRRDGGAARPCRAQHGERVVLATGHPVGLALFYHALDGCSVRRGAPCVAPRRRRAVARSSSRARLDRSRTGEGSA